MGRCGNIGRGGLGGRLACGTFSLWFKYCLKNGGGFFIMLGKGNGKGARDRGNCKGPPGGSCRGGTDN